MEFTETKLEGVYIIDLEPVEDERGFFSRTYCADEFEKHGLDPIIMQSSISYNKKKYTLRGMHYQAEPYGENKTVSCIKGSIQDVVIDLRKDSETYRQWLSMELSEINKKQVYIPRGFAHGFLTLENESIVSYNISEQYCADAARGVKYDDPAFGIRWQHIPCVISERDNLYRHISI